MCCPSVVIAGRSGESETHQQPHFLSGIPKFNGKGIEKFQNSKTDVDFLLGIRSRMTFLDDVSLNEKFAIPRGEFADRVTGRDAACRGDTVHVAVTGYLLFGGPEQDLLGRAEMVGIVGRIS